MTEIKHKLDRRTIKILYSVTHGLHKDIDLYNNNSLYRFWIAISLWWKLITTPNNFFTSARMRGLCLFLNSPK